MPNQLVLQRLTGLQSILKGVHQSSVGSLSSATTGQERAAVIDEFGGRALPPIYRFGTGDATDANGTRSGQLDVVVEYPFAPSLPTVGAGQTRLYLAESVAAVIEVKSEPFRDRWGQAVQTANALAPLQRSFAAAMTFGNPPMERIPLFAVGYTGWRTMSALQANLANCPAINGALVIDVGLYASTFGVVAHGPLALWGLIVDLHRITKNSLQSASTDPAAYGA